MAIPDFQTIMLPLLKAVGDSQEHAFRDIVELLAHQFGVDEEERKQLLPSGRAPLFYNRVGWAKSYLKKAGLIEQSKRSFFRITERGKQLLSTSPETLNMKSLEQFPEYLVFRDGQNSETAVVIPEPTLSSTPEELLEQSHLTITRALASELIDQLVKCQPSRFEEIVVDVLLALGYGGNRREAGKVVGRSGDGGIDGVINEDRLGLDAVYVQAKRWSNPVGVKEIRDFKGALDGHAATKGVLITTSSFNRGAIEEAQKSRNYRIVLIDGQRLASLMIENNVGVAIAATYAIKKIDSDYFSEEE